MSDFRIIDLHTRIPLDDQTVEKRLEDAERHFDEANAMECEQEANIHLVNFIADLLIDAKQNRLKGLFLVRTDHPEGLSLKSRAVVPAHANPNGFLRQLMGQLQLDSLAIGSQVLQLVDRDGLEDMLEDFEDEEEPA